MFTQQDLDQFAERGIGLEKVERQMQHLREGFGWLDVVSAATPKKGVKVMTGLETGDSFDAFTKNRLKVTKFVPASGAASRMFKDLYKVLETGEMNDAGFRFTSNIRQFAFYTRDMFFGLEPVKMIEKVLSDKDGGLGYGSKPKGVLLFHSYSDENRTAFEEHLVEGALYARMRDFTVNLVVSVSPEHLEMFRNLFEEVRHKYESRYGVKYNLEFTVQSPSTDTVAVDMDNNPFRREDGSILFRPGGHGALIENLGAIDSDIVVIKNIDNVVKENSIEQTIFWKKLLIGRLVLSRQSTFAAIARLQEAIRLGNQFDISRVCDDIATYLDDEYCVTLPPMPEKERAQFILRKLDRPIRVCGMVRNQGEPGGGPFIVRDADGSTSLQILESVQLNPDDERTAGLFAAGTHFNPVDLVCSLTDYKGEKFDLTKHVDENAGFISSKSYEGRPLKALELPGLWNGAMSDWNTIFIEVPLITFNPVKTVNDLLRKEHLG